MTITHAQLKISDAEFKLRAEKLLETAQASGCDAAVIFEVDYVKYYSGFAFIPTERPMAFIINKTGERSLFVPRLEVEHAQANTDVDRVDHYKEFPDKPHPMEVLNVVLQDMGINGPIAVDSDGYPWIFGYRGPSLSEVTGLEVRSLRGSIEDQMAIKSAAELNILRESCKWAHMAHQLLQRYTVPGVTETEVERRASNEATDAMLNAIGPLYKSQSNYFSGATAAYRGQIGRNAAIPHALANNIVFQPGDVLVTGASASVWGYVSELERTMILGQPSDDQKWMFDHMLALQDLALESIKPGTPCSDVDTAVRTYFEEHDLTEYWKHHTGHCIGLRYHEGPFLDIGDDTEIQVGMVFTVEPGLYAANLGGFRHSDTVAVTEDGIEFLTYYPRDLASLTLPV